ncbi:BatD family protein [Flavobacteriaceae bacterium D16]|nr:BatD family protein [Flavobacteriaceae bacterium D16]
MVKRYGIALLLFFSCSHVLWAQRAFADISANKSTVYVGEAVELTISAYTSTFFTRGVDVGNIQIPGAFSTYFRAVSVSKKINGTTYAGVQLIYNIFPFEESDLVIPALNIEVETPPEGGFKGVKRILKTPEKIIKIKPRPSSVDKNQWLVATNVRASEKWTGNPKQVKVGEVLERSISRNVYGTVAELIPPVVWDSIPGVGNYPTRSSVLTNKTKTAISATRTEGIRYLFEKEGAVVIPEMEFVWWHPRQKRFLKRTLPSQQIDVQPNPNLDLLASIRDSLSVEVESEMPGESLKTPTLILGLTPKQFALLLMGIGLAAYLLFKLVFWSRKYIKARLKEYRNSEAYSFKQFLSVVDGKNAGRILPKLYTWISKLQPSDPTLQSFASGANYEPLYAEIDRLESQLNDQAKGPVVLKKDIWKKSRKLFLKSTNAPGKLHSWINP